ncbi:MAG: cyclic pyranopterin monophosphate synthase MoaC [candidate division KSB1 bacterium]|nr:cyclic pyranopterin monophosphate synthase MoaC [candidate division KSB1 bacterium]MDZ7272801.1 cyclic pyranopterin monophosphate synthase MoaC [candidate division KSB1 bacterium]MDZ7284175.1 cyclic pyranopterin monophosphate synthase MoaC [candidate division KSB1 bacterium]MDZ7297427.1 cyclic pyranopterin monophosphate synthase MoaC [candidate division KSB1 bacterium]MDZ7308175.1 cyclic pyranopterin monophosphate synthase MoaC [candidate division KSB1 bacterium]
MLQPPKLTHVNASGEATMVDVGEKEVTRREAVARGEVLMQPETIALLARKALPKGDALAAARLAGIMAAKKTGELIPLCHPLGLDYIDVQINVQSDRLALEATVRCSGKTGVEMEALTAVAVAGLTLYDMCKAVDREMVIGQIRLVKKSGGRSGEYRRPGEEFAPEGAAATS